MQTSFQAFSDETRELALLDEQPPPAPARRRLLAAVLVGLLAGFVAVALVL